MSFVSLPQLVTSLDRLSSVHPFFGFAFFGFKKKQLPVGTTTEFSYRFIKEEILDRFYKIGAQPGYFNPFKSTNRWVSDRYESTSLQRIIADTFADAFIRDKGSGEWGWKRNYVQILERILVSTKTLPIPLLDLSVWLFRNHEAPERNPAAFFFHKLATEFFLTAAEMKLLCDPVFEGRILELSSTPVSDTDILNHVGWPEGASERSGVRLDELRLINVGPATELVYRPTSRINLITGDNSLGKTFLLDCAWWALTGEWMNYAADPTSERKVSLAEIDYTLSSGSGREEKFVAPFGPVEQEWQRPPQPLKGLAIYTNFSGSFAIWDPLRDEALRTTSGAGTGYLTFDRDQVWNGQRIERRGRSNFVSNGLINDWVTWRRAPDIYTGLLNAFEAALKELSPPDSDHLRAGEPARIANDSRDIPTLRMRYGSVPVVYASAGIQRILALAYILVSAWFRHTESAKAARRQPLGNIVIIIDEIESHLHPRWQRQIIPALMKAIEQLGIMLAAQLHISTHSPLVLASVEPLFDQRRDKIHNLVLNGTRVKLDPINVWKHGSVNYWLESEVFGLKEARSKPAEKILDHARSLQLEKSPASDEVEHVHQELVKLLPDDDPFWARWSYFYERHRRPRK